MPNYMGTIKLTVTREGTYRWWNDWENRYHWFSEELTLKQVHDFITKEYERGIK